MSQTTTETNVIPFTDALIKFSIAEGIISDLEDATKLEITDSASEKVVRKHRQNAKGLEVKINKTRLALNREFKEKTEQAAGLIAPRITAVYKTLNEKITAVETAREDAKAERAKAEEERIAAIQAKFDTLTNVASRHLEYNRPASDIEVDIASLEAFDVNETDFQERKIEADSIKAGAIVNAKSALTGRKAFEAAQAEAARVKAEQAAEAERLEKERARLEKAAIEAEALIEKEKEHAKQLEKERLEALEKATANMAAERKQLEADKAEAEKQAILLAREAVWEAANQDNFDFDHINGIAFHEKFKAGRQAEIDQARADSMARLAQTEQAKKDAAERLMLIGQDKIILQTIANDIDALIEKYDIPVLNTEDANALVCDLISSIKSRIFIFDNDARDLV